MVQPALPTITLVIPVYNEKRDIEKFVKNLFKFVNNASQIMIIDGKSEDGTYEALRTLLDNNPDGKYIELYQSKSGRARQMNYGAEKSQTDVIVFLHVDTDLPAEGIESVRKCIVDGALWGRFDVRLDASPFIYRLIETLMNWRSALTGIATGDQAIFARRDVFRMIGGYPDISLMEDVAISTRLKVISTAKRIRIPVITSARRWQENGILPTIFLMWTIRLAYWLGIRPDRLARWYHQAK